MHPNTVIARGYYFSEDDLHDLPESIREALEDLLDEKWEEAERLRGVFGVEFVKGGHVDYAEYVLGFKVGYYHHGGAGSITAKELASMENHEVDLAVREFLNALDIPRADIAKFTDQYDIKTYVVPGYM